MSLRPGLAVCALMLVVACSNDPGGAVAPKPEGPRPVTSVGPAPEFRGCGGLEGAALHAVPGVTWDVVGPEGMSDRRLCSTTLRSRPAGGSLQVTYASSGVADDFVRDRLRDARANEAGSEAVIWGDLGVGRSSTGVTGDDRGTRSFVLYASTRRTVITVLLTVPPSVEIATDEASLRRTAQELLRWAIRHEPAAVPGTK